MKAEGKDARTTQSINSKTNTNAMDTLHHLYRSHPKTCLFTTAALLRVLLVLIFPGLPDLLTLRVEISTPVSSFKRLQEGLFLYERGLDPYDGGIFNQVGLVVLFNPSIPYPNADLAYLLIHRHPCSFLSSHSYLPPPHG